MITAGLLGLVNQSRTRPPAGPRSAGPAGAAADGPEADGPAAAAGVTGGVAVAAMTPSSRYCGLKAIDGSSPEKSAGTVSLALAWPCVAARDRDPAGRERQLHRGAALGDQRDPPDRLREGLGGQVGGAAELVGEARPVPDELPRQQPRGQPPLARVEADHGLGRPAAAAADVPPARSPSGLSMIATSVPALIILAASLSVLAGTEQRDPAGVTEAGRRMPAKLPDREPVAVGRGERHRLPVKLDVDRGEHRQRVVAAGGRRHLADRGGERAAVRRARQLR